MRDLSIINEQIVDRSHVFYWQTDRDIDPVQAAEIWSDRHSAIKEDELLEKVNQELSLDKLVSIKPFEKDSHTNLGNINSVRVGILQSGEEVIIRCHPKGVANGYFHSESLVADTLNKHGLRSYKTYAIHDLQNESDFAFQVIEKLDGVPVQTWLESHREDEAKIIKNVGVALAKVHEIKVSGFGPFDNVRAKVRELIGLHDNFGDSLRASLEFNLEVLVKTKTLSESQAKKAGELFSTGNALLNFTDPVLVHNDFADWNQMTDGNSVTGIIDLDETVGSHPVSDIACWSTFFEPERLQIFLEGYFSVAEEIPDYEQLFELLRLRYTLSKMTLRLRKATWDDSEFLKEKIKVGQAHLAQSLAYFDI